MPDIVYPWTSKPTIWIKEKWSDNWQFAPGFSPSVPQTECLSLTLGLGHVIDQARIVYHSGEMLMPDNTPQGGTWVRQPRVDWIGYYVRIVNPGLDWVGIIIGEDRTDMDARDFGSGNEIAGSDQVFTVAGMEWLLDRRQITSTVFWGSPDEHRSQRGLGFNMGFGETRDRTGKERGNKDTRTASSGMPSFAGDVSHREEWNASQMVQHLLAFHGPSDVNFAPSAPEFTFDPTAYGTFLEWHKPTVALEGRTVLEVLREIISAHRGLVWKLNYVHNSNPAAATMELVVTSVFRSPVNLPNGDTLPANPNTSPLTVYSDQNFYPRMSQVRIMRDRSRSYDRIRVRGARRVSVFTVSPADGNLVEGWNTSVFEGEYRDANGLTNAEAADRFRKSEEYAHVYTRFLIEPNWDGKTRDGSGEGTFEFACPYMPQGSSSILDGEKFMVDGLRLLRQLPLKQGYDYTNATAPTSSDPNHNAPEPMLPLAIIKHNEAWLFLDRAAGSVGESNTTKRLKTSYHVRMLEGVPGIEITPAGGMPHLIAKGHFDVGSPAPSKFTPEVDYSDLRVTVAAEWDSFCEGYHPDTHPTSSPLHELTIYIGDRARLDYLAKGTIFDVDDGTIKTVATGGALRDDRELCRNLARLAWEWYTSDRASFEVACEASAFGQVMLGWFITDFIDFNQVVREPVNAIASQITHDFRAGKSTISGDFADIDFVGFV